MEEEEVKTENPGSAFGEAVGARMEIALNRYLTDIVSEYDCKLIEKGINSRTGKPGKLKLKDEHGTEYSIDAVIANQSIQPLILIESKYIRYTKHNRDKGSWICYTHNTLRRSYGSVRSSIAILAGNWSSTSLAMIKSRDVNVFLVPFSMIVDLLDEHGIKFDWGEKDRHVAVESWRKYQLLTEEQKQAIAEKMIEDIKEPVKDLIAKTLDDTVERIVDKVAVEIHTNIGELKRFEFVSIDDAINFLEDFGFEDVFDNSKAPTLWDKDKVYPTAEKGRKKKQDDNTDDGPLFTVPL